MDMMAAIEYILTMAQIVRLPGSLQKVSNDDTWARWCIILRKRAGIDKMDYHMFRRKYLWMLREARGGLKAAVGNRVKPA